MSTITIRLKEEEKDFLINFAKMNNKNLSEMIRETIFETLEDKYDLIELNKAIEEYEKNPIKYSSKEVWDELGI